MKHRVLICCMVPQHLVTQLHASQAANNFCERLIESEIFDEIYSMLPVSYNIPLDTQYKGINFFINGKTNPIAKIIKYISLNCTMAWLRKKDKLWFYNITPSFLLAYVLLKLIFKRKTYVIMADYSNPEKKISLQSIIGYLIKSSNGIISLSARSCFKHKNMIIKAGIISENMLNREDKNNNQNLIFLFSGLLSDITGYDMALKVFSRIPEAQLYISGNGNFPPQYKKFNNIHFMGNLPYNEYLNLLDNATVCLNFRNPNKSENNNNFPSKILDYFSRGKIVISTMKYPEIKGANYFYTEYNEESLINQIKSIIQIEESKLKQYKQNKDFLKKNFSTLSWINSIKMIENQL